MTEISSDNQKIQNLYLGQNFDELIEVGFFYGRKKSKIHPKMKPYVLAMRDGVGIINLVKTVEGLNEALNFLENLVKNSGLILVVGTQPAAEESVLNFAKKFNFPYVVNRWIGGTLTNFKVILKRVEYLQKIRADVQSGALDKYTKKERKLIQKEAERLEHLFGGLEMLTRQPDAVLLIDPNLHAITVSEARRLKIPIVSLINLDGNIELIDYPVIGNNKSKKSIDWFFSKLETAIERGLKSRITTNSVSLGVSGVEKNKNLENSN